MVDIVVGISSPHEGDVLPLSSRHTSAAGSSTTSPQQEAFHKED